MMREDVGAIRVGNWRSRLAVGSTHTWQTRTRGRRGHTLRSEAGCPPIDSAAPGPLLLGSWLRCYLVCVGAKRDDPMIFACTCPMRMHERRRIVPAELWSPCSRTQAQRRKTHRGHFLRCTVTIYVRAPRCVSRDRLGLKFGRTGARTCLLTRNTDSHLSAGSGEKAGHIVMSKARGDFCWWVWIWIYRPASTRSLSLEDVACRRCTLLLPSTEYLSL